jgi:hypothetical protein
MVVTRISSKSSGNDIEPLTGPPVLKAVVITTAESHKTKKTKKLQRDIPARQSTQQLFSLGNGKFMSGLTELQSTCQGRIKVTTFLQTHAIISWSKVP